MDNKDILAQIYANFLQPDGNEYIQEDSKPIPRELPLNDEEIQSLVMKIKKPPKKLPCERIAQKLKEDEYRRAQTEQKKIAFHSYYEDRQKQFISKENILQKLSLSFIDRQLLFKQIWTESNFNLKSSLLQITDKFLAERGIKLSDKEEKIVFYHENTLIIGRSGTGKTTTALVRLSAMDISFRKNLENNDCEIQVPELRNCFTSISNILKDDVENSYTTITNQKQRNFEPHSMKQVCSWPLFTCIRKLIHMIDGNLAIPFIQRDKNERIWSNQEYNIQNYLITKIKLGEEQYQEIGTRQFIEEFWKENKVLVDEISVDYYTSYSQIQSYITGNQMSFKYSDGMIPEEQYLKQIGKTKTHLDELQKKDIYKVCQKYQQWKESKKYFDQNDIVNYILQKIFAGEYDSSTGYFHYLFIDEVQDLNCAILYLLTLITEQNVFLAGDTAQTISLENCFRFTELKSFFQIKFVMEGFITNNILNQSLQQEQLTQNFRSHQQILNLNNMFVNLMEIFFPTSIDILIPEVSSKQGPKPILITDRKLLYKLIEIDFKVHKQQNLQNKEMVEKKENKQDLYCRAQAFLVRNQNEKDNLQKILQQENQDYKIFTILESKGLEFQDVITYNLLNSSFCNTSCWNVLNFLTTQLQKSVEIEMYIQKAFGKEFPKLIPELKNLYVAFSRARSRIFIYEDQIYHGKQIKNPIPKFLVDQGLLEERGLTGDSMQQIMVNHRDYIEKHEPEVNSDQLFQQARVLLEKQQFQYAADFFNRIGDKQNYYLCIGKKHAYDAQKMIENNKVLYESERRMYLNNEKNNQNQLKYYQTVKQEFEIAIQFFDKCLDYQSISQIYFTLGEYENSIAHYDLKRQLIKQNEEINLNQKQIQIQDIERDLKIVHLHNILQFEQSQKKNEQVDKNYLLKNKKYKMFQEFIKSQNKIEYQIVLFVDYQLEEIEQLSVNIVNFHKQQNINGNEQQQILDYYYPLILKKMVTKIFESLNKLRQNKEKKKDNQKSFKQIFGEMLTSLYKKLIDPFQQYFNEILTTIFNQQHLEDIQYIFQDMANQIDFCCHNQESGRNLLLFYSTLSYFKCFENQFEFNEEFKKDELFEITFVNCILSNISNLKKINNLLENKSEIKMNRLSINNVLKPNYQQYILFLGIYDLFYKSNFCSKNEYLNFTLSIGNDKIKINNDYLLELLKYQNFINNKYQLCELKNTKQYLKIQSFVECCKRQLKEKENFERNKKANQINNNNSSQKYLEKQKYRHFQLYAQRIEFQIFLEQFEQSIQELEEVIGQMKSNEQRYQMDQTLIQNLLFIFYYGMKIFSNVNCFTQFEDTTIEQIVQILSFIITFNTSLRDSHIQGKNNRIILDAICFIFGQIFLQFYLIIQVIILSNLLFYSHSLIVQYYKLIALLQNNSYISPLDINDFNQESSNIWDQLNFHDYYLVNSKSHFYQSDKKKICLKGFAPIKSKDPIKLKAINKKLVIFLCKNRIVLYFLLTKFQYLTNQKLLYQIDMVKQFLVGYTKYLVILTKDYRSNINKTDIYQKISQPIQVVYLEAKLKEFIQINLALFQLLQQDALKIDEIEQEIMLIENYIDELKQSITMNLNFDEKIKINLQIFLQQRQNKLQNKLIDLKEKQQNIQLLQQEQSKEFSVTSDEYLNKLKLNIIFFGICQKSSLQQQNIHRQMEIFLFHQIFNNLEKAYIEQLKANEDNKNQDKINENKGEQDQQPSNEQSQNQVDQEKDEQEDYKDYQTDNNLEQDSIFKNQKYQQRQANDQGILKYCDNILFIFSVLSIRQMTFIIKSQYPQLFDEIEYIKYSFNFFESKQKGDQLGISLNSLKLLEVLKNHSNPQSQFFLLMQGLSEIFQFMYPNDQQTIILIKGFNKNFKYYKDYDGNQKTQINIYKYKNIFDKEDNNKCDEYFHRLIKLFSILNISQKKRLIAFDVIVNLILFKFQLKESLLMKQYFLADFGIFLNEIIDLKKMKNLKIFQYPYNLKEEYDIYMKKNHKKSFRNRFFKTLIILLNKQDISSAIKLLINIQPKDLNLFIFNEFDEYEVNIINRQYTYQNRFSNEYYQKKMLTTNSISLDSFNNNLKEQINYFKNIDIVYLITQLDNNKSIFQRYSDIISQNQNILLDILFLIDKVRREYLKQLKKERVNSGEKFIYVMSQLNKISLHERNYYKSISNQEIIKITPFNNNQIEIYIKEKTNACINIMQHIYQDYLIFLLEPLKKLNPYQELNNEVFLNEYLESQYHN